MAVGTVDPKGYTVDRFARILRLSRAAVYRRIETGEIVAVKFHVRPGCVEPCRCPVRIPMLFAGEYLSRHQMA